MPLAAPMQYAVPLTLWPSTSTAQINGQLKKLIPKDELDEAVKKGCTEVWDLAEYFGVTEPFMLKAIEYYKAQELCQ